MLEAGDIMEPEAVPTDNAALGEKVIKASKALAEFFGSESPEDAPQQNEGESNEQYSERLVQYAGLDAETMAQAGLEPGSQEYYEYIMAQMDAIINQVLEGVDVDAQDLSDQLRTKTDQELISLRRAIFVRGQLGQLMGSGTYLDPTTGIEQEVIGSGMFDPAFAGFQRGRASEAQALAGLGGEEAYIYLQDLLNRNPDFFGMQQSANERFERAKLEDSEIRRRRGMFDY
jgi:hypothetical protein